MDSQMIKALETCEKMHGREFDVVEQVIFRTAYAMGVQDHQSETTAEIAKLRDLIEEQKGTIKALNIALGGEESTSTENCVDAYELDPLEDGLISRCRKLMAHIDNLDSTFSEMLPALELLVAGIEGTVSETYIPLVKARAAIAKATTGQ